MGGISLQVGVNNHSLISKLLKWGEKIREVQLLFRAAGHDFFYLFFYIFPLPLFPLFLHVLD